MIFDMDGTLVVPFTTSVLPKVEERIISLRENGHTIAIASNAGGVGFRWAIENDEDIKVWAQNKPGLDINEYPTIENEKERIQSVADKLDVKHYVQAFRYVSKGGDPFHAPSEDGEWSVDWRKPNGGMIKHLMRELSFEKHRTFYVGDRNEDRLAAFNAGVLCFSAVSFFGWDFQTVRLASGREKPT